MRGLVRNRRLRRLLVSWSPTTDLAATTRLLSDLERDRVSRYRSSSDADRYIAARVLLRVEVARWMNVDPDEVMVTATCPQCGAEHGKVRVSAHSKVRP